MAARSAAAAAAACDAVRGAASRLRSCYSSISASSSPGALAAALAALLCCGAAAAAFPRAAASLLPLAATTSLCCAAAGLFAAEERGSADAVEGVVLAGGRCRGKPEAGLVQVIGEANASAYAGGGGGVQVGCFLRRSPWRGVDDDGEEVVFAGTLAPCLAGGAGAGGVQRLGHGALEEEVAAMRVDRLAEGVWDSYFGGWSRWHDVDAAA